MKSLGFLVCVPTAGTKITTKRYCKDRVFAISKQIFLVKIPLFHKFGVSLQPNRDVAQLVAYYVRDVGVASSNPVIPT